MLKKIILIASISLALAGYTFGSSGSGNVSSVISAQSFGPNSAGNITIPFASINTSGLVTVCGGNTSTTSGNYYGLYLDSSDVYSNTGGSFYLTDVWVLGTATNSMLQLVHGTAVGGWTEGGSTAPTGAVYMFSPGTAAPGPFQTSGTASTWQHYSMIESTPVAANSVWMFRPGGSANQYWMCIQGIVK